MRSRKFLIIAGIGELILLVPAFLIIVFIGYQGFAAGEMGNMVGMFSAAVLLFLLPYLVIRVAAVYGLRKTRPWAAVLCIVLSALLLAGSIFSAVDFPLLFALIVLYSSFSIWAAIRYLRKR